MSSSSAPSSAGASNGRMRAAKKFIASRNRSEPGPQASGSWQGSGITWYGSKHNPYGECGTRHWDVDTDWVLKPEPAPPQAIVWSDELAGWGWGQWGQVSATNEGDGALTDEGEGGLSGWGPWPTNPDNLPPAWDSFQHLGWTRHVKPSPWYAVVEGYRCGVFNDQAYVDTLIANVWTARVYMASTEDEARSVYQTAKNNGELHVWRSEDDNLDELFGPLEAAIE